MADLRTAIISEAARLGISPVDLATVISYETAGTFDPAKAGPTTKWGRHRGLIQWGEPQAKKYGVDFADPAKQMQAVSAYLTDAGVRPGMGILDVYSAINAGKVGRYNASDEKAGGAPGTVRDKVEKQMGGHREKAVALLGGEYSPAQPQASAPAATQPAPSSQPSAGILASLMGDEPAAKTTDSAQRLAAMFMGTDPTAQAAGAQQQNLMDLAAARLAWARRNGWSA